MITEKAVFSAGPQPTVPEHYTEAASPPAAAPAGPGQRTRLAANSLLCARSSRMTQAVAEPGMRVPAWAAARAPLTLCTPANTAPHAVHACEHCLPARLTGCQHRTQEWCPATARACMGF